jgi:hypothetical protein
VPLAVSDSRLRFPKQTPAADLVLLDTIGKLHAHGHGLGGHRRACRR